MKKVLSCILVMALLVSLVGCGGSKCTSIVLSASEVSLSQPGQTKGLTVTKNPADAADKVSFKSSNSSVAVVDEYGLITAVGEGSATVTVTCGDAVAFYQVTVGSGSGANNPGSNNQPGGNQTDNSGESNTQPQGPVTVDCPDCGGNGEHTCTSCNGDYQCKACGGSGVDPDYVGCTGVPKYGMGAVVCGACFGYKVCQKCDNGIMVCRTCGGDGKICDECNNGECSACGAKPGQSTGTTNNTTGNNGGTTQTTPGNDFWIPEGHTRCSACNGKQINCCKTCGGYGICPNEDCTFGYVYCTRCGGAGSCPSCHGTKENWAGGKCSTCRGDGDCPECNGDKKFKCSTCNGSKECPTCHDAIWCTTCDGKGYI